MNATRASTPRKAPPNRLTDVTRKIESILVGADVPSEPCHLPAEAEAAADAWIRSVIYGSSGGPLDLPKGALVRRSLRARCRFAAAHACMLGKSGGDIPATSENALLEVYLVGLWHEQFRVRWLNGEKCA